MLYSCSSSKLSGSITRCNRGQRMIMYKASMKAYDSWLIVLCISIVATAVSSSKNRFWGLSSCSSRKSNQIPAALAKCASEQLPPCYDELSLIRFRGGGGDGDGSGKAVIADQTTVTTVTNGGVAEAEEGQDNYVEQQFRKARISYVKQNLIERLQYVQKRNRMKDFAKWVHKQGGEAKVLSMHGVEANTVLTSAVQEDYTKRNPLRLIYEESKKQSNPVLERRSRISTKRRIKDPFNEDILDLDLIPQDITEVGRSSISITGGSNSSQMTTFSRNLSMMKHFIEDDNKDPTLVSLFFRSIQLTVHFFPVVSTMWLAVLSRKFRENHWFSLITDSLGRGGAAFIKWGQWAATRNDMFSEKLCDELSRLHNSAPAHSWSISEKTVEACLGIPHGSLREVFDDFDSEPIASGSIAQVHKASIDGKTVAVKIRHPSVAKKINMDFRIMTAATRIFDYIPGLSWLHIRESVDQFSHTMAAQAHLHVEAHHLEILNFNFRRWSTVRFPEPFYASPAVIIETFEPGRIVSNVYDSYEAGTAAGVTAAQRSPTTTSPVVIEAEEGEKTEHDKKGVMNEYDSKSNSNNKRKPSEIPMDMAKFIVTTGSSLYLKMLMVDNLMHADFHPGNILIAQRQAENSVHTQYGGRNRNMNRNRGSTQQLNKENKFTITLIDAGMVAQLTDEESATFLGLMACIGEGDGKSAAEYALNFCLNGGNDSIPTEDRTAFIEEMGVLFKKECRGYGTNVSMGDVLRGVLGLIRKYHVRIDANFATLTVNLLCLESMARRACPDYNILDCAQPILTAYRRLRFRRDGSPIPLAEIKKNVQSRLPLMLIQKQINDEIFFKEYARSRKAII